MHPLDLEIGAGEYFCILGPSGSGKTTLLRMLAGFEAPDAGEIHLDGVRVDGFPPERRDTNTVFQEYALFPHLSVFENVAFGPRMKGGRGNSLSSRVLESLALVGLEGHGDRSPATLSGGEQQRVALARALVNRPRVLLLDEPLAALDRKLRSRMQIELSRIQRESQVAFVHVTHDQEEALRLADRVAVMRAGRFLQVGAPEEVYDRPNSAFVADFLGSANIFRARPSDGSLFFPDGTRVSIGSRPFDAGGESERLYAIRPEAFMVIREGGGEDPSGGSEMIRLPAMITGRSRVGGVEELDLRVGPLRFVAHLRGPAPVIPYAPSDRVVLLLHREDIVPLVLEGGEEDPDPAPGAARSP